MRIAFLCSSLEQGRDGVGDYTWLLAEECVRQGHDCALMALHDRHLDKPLEDGAAGSEKSCVPLLRLPATMPRRECTARARAFRARFRPDWLSLQFVPYGFNDKGIVAGLAKQIREISDDSPRIHIMFHELWIGGARQSSFRQRVIGAIQRRHMVDMLKRLKPAVIHTHAPVYAGLLRQAGFGASILPLFSNIPIASHRDLAWLWREFAAAGCPITDENRNSFWLAGLFGTLHPEWQPEAFLSIVRGAARTSQKTICLVGIGRLGAGETRWEQLASEYSKEIFFLKLGELPAEKVSLCLQALDFGVTTSPWLLTGKSGTVATMLDHGLPVIVTRDDVAFKGSPDSKESKHPRLIRLDAHLESRLVSGLPRRAPLWELSSITNQFLNALSGSERPTVESRCNPTASSGIESSF